MKIEILKFKRVTSTNDIAIKMIKNKKRKAGCVHADIQTKGKGTYGKEWISKKGNLFSSIFFQLHKSYPTYDEFSVINSILISNVIKNFCINKNVKLKFPNDIFVNGKKICGILQEIITLNSKKFLIIGIGLNIVSNPVIYNKYKATNILAETKKKYKIKEILELIIDTYANFFADINSYNYDYFKKKSKSMTLKRIA
tara:strand:+ start:45 stop:638 length:594 start_codon:yes stop_codon:yes gene_type:complete